jgi:mediator of RNA polymerase II transcription subunit 8
LSIQRNLFTSLHAYPLPTFPGAQQEGLLQQLLRKKLDPKAEAWIEESRALRQAENGLQGSGHETGTLADEDYRELWSWAKETQLEQLRELAEVSAWDDAYTIKEREDGVENVVTGIKRDLDKNEQDDDKMDESDAESEGEGLASVKSSVPLESLLSFASGQDVAGLG